MHRRPHRVRSLVTAFALAALVSAGMLATPAASSASPSTPTQTQGAEPNECLTVDPSTEALETSDAASIYRLYCAFFLRPPQPDGLRYWLGVAQSRPLTSIASTFASGAEFQNRYGPLGESDFVDLVFGNVMGRPSAEKGRVYWAGRLDTGMSRGAMMLNFSDSVEFKRRTDSERPVQDPVDPSPAEEAYYANCTAARQAGAAPIRRGEPGYGSHLDRDGDGIACEV